MADETRLRAGPPEFEVHCRDGLARIGTLSTPHGPIETPALLPVVHPDPHRQAVPPRELRGRFGYAAVMTSAYIAWKNPHLREQAEKDGIHRVLDFDGPVMTDSGAFQQHAYGHVDIGPTETLDFQNRIGSDIATPLDSFCEPLSDRATAEQSVASTREQIEIARSRRSGLLAAPVQGGRFPDLRFASARFASDFGEILAVGGVVPLLESYRFAELAQVLATARPGLDPARVVHLFGTGHPMSFAFAALFGVDLFDSSAYSKFARRGQLIFPDGTLAVQRIRERACRCDLCSETPLTEVARWNPPKREAHLARHNLLISAAEVGEVRQAIRDRTLWELVERRAAAHPALIAGLRVAVRETRVFLPTEPESRPSFRESSGLSRLRPSAIRFLAHLGRFRSGKGTYHVRTRRPLTPRHLSITPTEVGGGHELQWECPTPLGPVPWELSELYPVGCWVGVDDYEVPWASDSDRPAPPEFELDGLEVERERDWTESWTRRQVRSLLEWAWGPSVASTLEVSGATGERSRATGRLRWIRLDRRPGFSVGNDGLPRPTWFGALLLHSVVPAPRLRITCDQDSAPFVAEGRSLFSRFVEAVDGALVPGSSALLVDLDDRLLAVGRLVLAPHEMGRLRRGVAARVTAHARSPPGDSSEEPSPRDSSTGPKE